VSIGSAAPLNTELDSSSKMMHGPYACFCIDPVLVPSLPWNVLEGRAQGSLPNGSRRHNENRFLATFGLVLSCFENINRSLPISLRYDSMEDRYRRVKLCPW
jgi:hypothetical protein